LKEYEKAKENMLKVLEVKRKYFGENTLDYANILSNLANILSYLNDYKGAIKVLENVLKIKK
jgi:tetratricopeptide (TPR) repeat protein